MNASPTTPALPLPGGYVLQPVTLELLVLLRRADGQLAKIIPVLEKFIPKVLKSRSEIGRRMNQTRLKFAMAAKARECGHDTVFDTFILTHDVNRSTELLDQGRDSLLRAAWSEFNRLKPGEFGRLSHLAGEYFGQWFYDDAAKRRAR